MEFVWFSRAFCTRASLLARPNLKVGRADFELLHRNERREGDGLMENGEWRMENEELGMEDAEPIIRKRRSTTLFELRRPGL